MTQKATPFGTLAYRYDAQGNLTGLASSHADGAAVTYGYDVLDRLSSVNDAHVGATTYGYDAVGNLASTRLPNAVSTTYGYDGLNRLTGLTVSQAAGGGVQRLASYAYGLNAAGQRTGVAELGGRMTAYGYDGLGRLVSETVTGALNGSPNGQAGYTLDAVGNRLARSSSLAGLPAASHGYDTNDRLLSDAYDANGNTRQSGSSQDVYDSFDRLVSRSGGANGPVSILYDGDGHKVVESSGGVTKTYLVDDRNPTDYAQAVEELTNGVVTRVYTWGHQLVSQDQVSGNGQWQASFYGCDGHGNVRLLTDGSGAVTDRYDYDAWGNLLAKQGATINSHLYCGEEFDHSLGLYHQRARLMNPLTGRFWTQDSFEGFSEVPVSLHKYLYGSADPINLSDPSGYDTDIASLGVASTIAASLTVIALPQYRESLGKAGVALFSAGVAGLNQLAGIIFSSAAATLTFDEAREALREREQARDRAVPDAISIPYSEGAEPRKRKTLYHYTNRQNALDIESSGFIKASERKRFLGITFPQGAYATDIAPYDRSYTQRALSALFYGGNPARDVSFYVAVDAAPFRELKLPGYPHQWIAFGLAGQLIPVTVYGTGPNYMLP